MKIIILKNVELLLGLLLLLGGRVGVVVGDAVALGL